MTVTAFHLSSASAEASANGSTVADFTLPLRPPLQIPATAQPTAYLSSLLFPNELAWRVDAHGAGYMFDSGQRSYISKQVGEFEQGSLQGTLLSISLLTAAFASFLSNLCFSFFISDTFVRAVGQTFPGGQFLVSAMCFLLAEWNTNHAFASPTVSAHDRVQQMSHAAQGPAQRSTARRSSGSILEEKLLHG